MEFRLIIKNLFRIRVKAISLLFVFLFVVLVSLPAHSAISHDMSLQWKTLKSSHFELHFHDGEKKLAIKIISLAEDILEKLQPTFGWIPKEKIEIIVTNEYDFANGFVIAPYLPSLRMTLFVTAPDTVTDYSNWLELLVTHELTHVLHIDKVSGNAASIRGMFGRHPLSFPNIFQPAWMLEGLATFKETDVDRKAGRGQSDIYDMMMRIEVRDGIKSYEEINVNTANWPVGATRYLYGVHFFQFLKSKYSEASISRFIDAYSDNVIPFRINSNSRIIFGKSLPELWQQFKTYLNKKYIPELAQIAAHDIVQGERLTHTGYYKMFAEMIAEDKLLYGEYNGETRPAIKLKKMKLNETEIITEIQPETRIDVHPDAGILFSQIEVYRNTNYLYDLFLTDLEVKKIKRLTRGERYRKAVWNPDGDKVLALYNNLGKHTLALLNEDGSLIDLLWEGEENEVIGEYDWSPDGNYIVASVKRGSKPRNIEEFSLNTRHWSSISENAYNDIQPQYDDAGEYIYYSANYNGVYNLYRYRRNDHAINQLTNVEGGAFYPKPNSVNQIIYIGYDMKGYDVYRLEEIEELFEVTSLEQYVKQDVEIPKAVFEAAAYNSLGRISPTWWSPTFSFGKNVSQIGAYVTGSDALSIHSYDASAAFDFDSSAVSAELNYTYDRWFPVLQTHLSSVNRNHRRKQIYSLEVLTPFLERNQKWYVGYGLRREHTKTEMAMLPDVDVKDALMSFGGIYDSRKKNILSNSLSDGRFVSLVFETNSFLRSNFDGSVIVGKWQEYINFKQQRTLALRFIGGLGLENPRLFQLGGVIEDNNYFSVNPLSTTPFQTTLYNQRSYALRGYKVDAESLRGRRMLMYNLEWRFPLSRIEKSASSYPVGINQISGALFMESGAVWDDGINPNGFHYSFGSEVNFHTEFFYYVPLELRAGYAYGIDDDGEHLIYLTGGSSF